MNKIMILGCLIMMVALVSAAPIIVSKFNVKPVVYEEKPLITSPVSQEQVTYLCDGKDTITVDVNSHDVKTGYDDEFDRDERKAFRG